MLYACQRSTRAAHRTARYTPREYLDLGVQHERLGEDPGQEEDEPHGRDEAELRVDGEVVAHVAQLVGGEEEHGKQRCEQHEPEHSEEHGRIAAAEVGRQVFGVRELPHHADKDEQRHHDAEVGEQPPLGELGPVPQQERALHVAQVRLRPLGPAHLVRLGRRRHELAEPEDKEEPQRPEGVRQEVQRVQEPSLPVGHDTGPVFRAHSAGFGVIPGPCV